MIQQVLKIMLIYALKSLEGNLLDTNKCYLYGIEFQEDFHIFILLDFFFSDSALYGEAINIFPFLNR